MRNFDQPLQFQGYNSRRSILCDARLSGLGVCLKSKYRVAILPFEFVEWTWFHVNFSWLFSSKSNSWTPSLPEFEFESIRLVVTAIWSQLRSPVVRLGVYIMEIRDLRHSRWMLYDEFGSASWPQGFNSRWCMSKFGLHSRSKYCVAILPFDFVKWTRCRVNLSCLF